VNPLQELIRRRMAERDWSYSDIARRGSLPRSTVHHLAKNERPARSPHPQTLTRLALGLELPASLVRATAARAAGYELTEYDVAAYQPTAYGTAAFRPETGQPGVSVPGTTGSVRPARPAPSAGTPGGASSSAPYGADEVEVRSMVAALRRLSREDRRHVALLVRSLLERHEARNHGHSPAPRP
jgi:transcriptional regulator with XRE-family HTH domain